MSLPDPESIARRYADASDAELREARRLGPHAFRPEAWRVIEAELGRRQLPRERRHERLAGRAVRAGRTTRRQEWTPELLVGIVPAGAAAVGAFRVMVHAGMGAGRGARGVVWGAAVVFFAVWFGVALLVDWRRWWPGRR